MRRGSAASSGATASTAATAADVAERIAVLRVVLDAKVAEADAREKRERERSPKPLPRDEASFYSIDSPSAL